MRSGIESGQVSLQSLDFESPLEAIDPWLFGFRGVVVVVRQFAAGFTRYYLQRERCHCVMRSEIMRERENCQAHCSVAITSLISPSAEGLVGSTEQLRVATMHDDLPMPPQRVTCR